MATVRTQAQDNAARANADLRLRRVLGMPSLVFFGLAYMVPLTVWTTYGVVTTSTGGHLPIAYVITTLAMILTAYSYGRMVRAFPVAGSAYSYASATFGGKAGFLTGWILMLDYIFLPMICYLVIGLYMHDYVPSIPMWIWIAGSVIVVTAMNILGIKVVTGVNITVVSLQFVFVAVFVALSLAKLAGAGDTPSLLAPFVSDGMDLQAVVAGSAILALSFLGFDAVSTLSEETRNPGTRIPRAIMLCAITGGAIYIVQSYVAHLVVPDYGTFRNVDVATVDVMQSVGGDLLNTFFTAAYVTAVLACAAASQASVSRILFAMGRDGVLPQRVFGRLHRRYRTPAMANVVVGVFGLLALFVSLTTASSVISFGALAAFSMVNLAVIKYYVIDRGHRSGGDLARYLVVPGVGVAFTVYLWTNLSGLTFKIGIAWLGVGFVYLLVLTRGFTRQPPKLDMGEPDMDCVRQR